MSLEGTEDLAQDYDTEKRAVTWADESSLYDDRVETRGDSTASETRPGEEQQKQVEKVPTFDFSQQRQENQENRDRLNAAIQKKKAIQDHLKTAEVPLELNEQMVEDLAEVNKTIRNELSRQQQHIERMSKVKSFGRSEAEEWISRLHGKDMTDRAQERLYCFVGASREMYDESLAREEYERKMRLRADQEVVELKKRLRDFESQSADRDSGRAYGSAAATRTYDAQPTKKTRFATEPSGNSTQSSHRSSGGRTISSVLDDEKPVVGMKAFNIAHVSHILGRKEPERDDPRRNDMSDDWARMLGGVSAKQSGNYNSHVNFRETTQTTTH